MRDDRFLITGLPRSRTAWFSALCNTIPGVRCWHEPTGRGVKTWRQAADVWLGSSDNYRVGIADPTLGLHLPEIIVEYQPRILWIVREPDDVTASLDKLGILRTNLLELYPQWPDLILRDPSIQMVRFANLQDGTEVSRCLWWLVPNYFMDPPLIEEFQRLNIQVKPEATQAEVAASKAHLPHILGEKTWSKITGRP